MKKVLIPIPSRDFDPSEVAISWSVLRRLGHEVEFATPDGCPGEADEIMLTGRGIPLFGLVLRANLEARKAYAEMEGSAAFRTPRAWDQVKARDYDGLLLPGGHRARGMREYLESKTLQALVADFFHLGKPVAAVCHGVLLAARSVDPLTGRSVLHGRKTTALTWKLERKAALSGRIGRFWDPNYYRTYVEEPGQPAGYRSVQQEVTRALARPEDFLDVPADAPDYGRKTSGLVRDTWDDGRAAWVVTDGAYVSARWPGDVHTFAKTFGEIVGE
jgi:putative intracellular protease/amidase